MDKPFFSVILPLHNAEKYMRKMLDSIRMQTFKDYELILVCDKCTDKTEEIAREYSNIVLVVDYGNAGPTRNAALDIAKGEWVLFADDDDWFLHPYVFENVAQMLKGEDEIDVLAFSFIWKMDEKNSYTHAYRPNAPYNMWVAPWTKAWRRSFIGDHRFPTNWKHSDDLGFAEEMHPLIHKAMFWDQAIYYYNYMHKGSTQWKLKTGELSNDDMRE
jgi:glycosyltransferase involved in cell wall biosynthesis